MSNNSLCVRDHKGLFHEDGESLDSKISVNACLISIHQTADNLFASADPTVTQYSGCDTSSDLTVPCGILEITTSVPLFVLVQ